MRGHVPGAGPGERPGPRVSPENFRRAVLRPPRHRTAHRQPRITATPPKDFGAQQPLRLRYLSGLASQPAPPGGNAVALDGGPPVPQLDQPWLNHLQAVEEPQHLGVTAVGVLLVANAVNAVPRFSQLGLE